MTEDAVLKMLAHHGHFLVGERFEEHVGSALMIRLGVLMSDSDIRYALLQDLCLVCSRSPRVHGWVRHLEFESWWAKVSRNNNERAGLIPPFPEEDEFPGPGLPAKTELTALFKRLPFPLPTGFNLGDIHYVQGIGRLSGRIGMTDIDGATEGYVMGMYVINVSGESSSTVDRKIPFYLSKQDLPWDLTAVLEAIDEGLSQGNGKVVVHSALGMERAPLAVYWYLHRRRRMPRQQAWGVVVKSRPVVIDRRWWLRHQT